MLILVTLISWLVITVIIDAYLMTLPKLDLQKEVYPDRYQIEQKNRFDIQNKYECAAFSTAYILRHFGLEEKGMELYEEFPCKMKSGSVYPKGIRRALKHYGFQTKYYKGNISTLKKQISKGVPVIVFIKVQLDQKYLHFVPVTGYDYKNLYLAESLDFLINCDNCSGYNRAIPIKEFKKLWNIKDYRMPIFSYTYITVVKNYRKSRCN